ncbi:hypothetical protein AALN73_18760 [Bacteroides stercorirosoris]|uniref:hypothetical protein n=1 Tax=Bacteroides stercorirosoris TaxID=871324 RepID=UPI000B1DC6D0|nr:hypothetical protein [Bacteroides stercorirosoris]
MVVKVKREYQDVKGQLYQQEEEYRRLELSADEIHKKRNDDYTNKVVDDFWK